MKSNTKRSRLLTGWLLATVVLVGCQRRQAMYNQPKITPFKESDFFADGRGVRPPVPGTVPHSNRPDDELLQRGVVGGKLATEWPFPVTRQVIERGANRFKIYCTPCHGMTGEGNGMVVQRGFYPPPTFHQDRLRIAPPGHFFNVITNGLGNMNGYAVQLKPEDRWAVIAYIRALQISQGATLADVPADKRAELEAQR